MGSWSKRHRAAMAWGMTALAAGLLLRGLFPALAMDDRFWRSFWSGPPAAGLFALAGALVAFAAAHVGTRSARRAAEREEWWNRAEWALDLARSRVRSERVLGLRTLAALKGDATETELDMLVAVADVLLGEKLDAAPEQADNGRKRWMPWQR